MNDTKTYSLQHILSRFYVIGINYRTANTVVRGQFAVNIEKYTAILACAKQKRITSLFVVSTCNRTEIYAYVSDVNDLKEIWIENTDGNSILFENVGFVKIGTDALQHFFSVTSGLDSQITGDHEIVGQIKQAVNFARKHDMIGPVMDRTVNLALQASKKIRTVTKISNGTVSVSYATIEWLRNIKEISSKHLAIIGTGKFGRNICKNIIFYLNIKNLTVCNRTNEIAQQLAIQSGIVFQPYEDLEQVINQSDIVIVCTHAGSPHIKPGMVHADKPRIFIDLSVPANVEPTVGKITGQQIINVDEISTQLTKTIACRKAEIPVAQSIVLEYLNEFTNWLNIYQHSKYIKDIKEKLVYLDNLHAHDCTKCTFKTTKTSDDKIQRTVNKLVVDLRTKKEKGCQFIIAYNHFLNQVTNEI